MLLNRILSMPNPVHPTHAKLFSMCGKITLHHFHPCIERKYACSEYFFSNANRRSTFLKTSVLSLSQWYLSLLCVYNQGDGCWSCTSLFFFLTSKCYFYLHSTSLNWIWSNSNLLYFFHNIVNILKKIKTKFKIIKVKSELWKNNNDLKAFHIWHNAYKYVITING